MSLKLWLVVVSVLLAVSLFLNVVMILICVSVSGNRNMHRTPAADTVPSAEVKVLGQTHPGKNNVPGSSKIPVAQKTEPVKLEMPVFSTADGRMPINDAFELLRQTISVRMPQDNSRETKSLLDMKIKILDSFLETYKDSAENPVYIKATKIHNTSKVLREVYGN